MRLLGLLVLVSATGLLFLGYSKKSDDSWTMSTPEGYAAPVPLDKGSWKDNLPEIVKSEEPEPESKLVLEMAPEVQARPAKPAKKAKIAKAKKKAKRVAKARKARRQRPSVARR